MGRIPEIDFEVLEEAFLAKARERAKRLTLEEIMSDTDWILYYSKDPNYCTTDGKPRPEMMERMSQNIMNNSMIARSFLDLMKESGNPMEYLPLVAEEIATAEAKAADVLPEHRLNHELGIEMLKELQTMVQDALRPRRGSFVRE